MEAEVGHLGRQKLQHLEGGLRVSGHELAQAPLLEASRGSGLACHLPRLDLALHLQRRTSRCQILNADHLHAEKTLRHHMDWWR